MKKENSWINVHDDHVMREMGFFRPFNQSLRDESVWKKTPKEKRMLKKMRHSCKRDMHFNLTPQKGSTVYAKLIVQLKPNKVFPKSTYSQKCLNTQINDLLDRFIVTNPKTGYSESVVIKYSFNGKTYTI